VASLQHSQVSKDYSRIYAASSLEAAKTDDYGQTTVAEDGIANKGFQERFRKGFWAPLRRRDEEQFGSIGAASGV
jgi:hypothetical protein